MSTKPKERPRAKDKAGSALEVRDLWAGYDGKAVLEAVNFQVDRGDMVGIIGPNGSGKSDADQNRLGIGEAVTRRSIGAGEQRRP